MNLLNPIPNSLPKLPMTRRCVRWKLPAVRLSTGLKWSLPLLKLPGSGPRPPALPATPTSLRAKIFLQLTHLCAFGQQPEAVIRSASSYIAAARDAIDKADSKGTRNLAMAFDYKVQAYLNLHNPDDAVTTVQTMLRTVPYDEFSSEASNSTLRYIRLIRPDQALGLLALRQPILLSSIRAYALPGEGTPRSGTVDSAYTQRPLPLQALYADAIALPAMQQFVNQPKAASDSFVELEAALPTSLSSDDGALVSERRRQYLLLGSHLPTLRAMGSLVSPDAAPPENLNNWFGHASVFLLFPDWCNQCIAMTANSASKARELKENFHVRFFALMTQASSPVKLPTKTALKDVPLPRPKSKSVQGNSAQADRLHVDQQVTVKSTPDTQLADTPTLVVPNEALGAFAADDFPLIVATDHDGIVRTMQVAAEDALAPGGDIDQIVQNILATWPAE